MSPGPRERREIARLARCSERTVARCYAGEHLYGPTMAEIHAAALALGLAPPPTSGLEPTEMRISVPVAIRAMFVMIARHRGCTAEAVAADVLRDAEKIIRQQYADARPKKKGKKS